MTIGLTLTSRGRRMLRLALALTGLLALAGGSWLWLRDSGLVRVRNVQITGTSASDGPRVRAALEEAALGMTTLHVRDDVLRQATASYTSVAALDVKSDFPRGLKIRVIERRPVAALAEGGSARVPVTGTGVVLRGVTAERGLPSLVLQRPEAGPRVTDRRVLRALAIAGAAPEPLLRRSDALQIGSRGVVVSLRNGPQLVFGTDEAARTKWTAAARVLAETSAAGATYLDLRIPGRVAAGGLSPVTPTVDETNPQPEAQNGTTLNP
jgi:cell division protein FtsQ